MTSKENPSGFNCPHCDFRIEVTVSTLLFNQSIQCPSCLTQFSLAQESSQETVDRLQTKLAELKDLPSEKDL